MNSYEKLEQCRFTDRKLIIFVEIDMELS